MGADKVDALLKDLGMQQFHCYGIQRRCKQYTRRQQEIYILDG
jgi:hypothetical protein